MKLLFAVTLLIAIAISSCAPYNKVERVNPNQQIDLSGRWNDTDSRLVAEEMISDVLSRAWLENHRNATGNKPVVIVGSIKNKSHEHINTETFIKDMEKEFVNSNTVRVVQSKEFREEIRDERADQQEYSSAETIKRWRQETGADYMLQGVVNSIVDSDRDAGQKVNYYQIDLELTNLETNEKVWIGDKKIKKLVTEY
ncbi:MAG: penicillin-binding protein activator LpoB [Calditrichia bacterium]